MAPPSLSLTFAFTFAFSLSTPHASLPQTPSPPRLAADILSLLGSPRDAAAVPAAESRAIRSCLRFLVPPPPRSSLLASPAAGAIWWPPPPVMELARLAVDSGGDPAAVQRILDPTPLPDLNSYLAFLFDTIVARGPSIGLNTSLTRYDLFHGHLFLAAGSGRLGILFHAKEYPEYDKKVFPYNTGYCQKGSNVVYDDSLNLRNILWLAPLPSNARNTWLAPGVLVALDVRPDGIIYKEMVPEYVDYVRTIYEDDFGDVVVDVNYLNVVNAAAGDKIFLC